MALPDNDRHPSSDWPVWEGLLRCGCNPFALRLKETKLPELNPVPLTALQAVNQILQACGLSRIQSLSTEGDTTIANAVEALNTTITEVLTDGWYFNTEQDLPVDPNLDGEIVLPAGAVGVTIAGRSRNMWLTERAGKMYDKQKHTFNIGKTVYLNMTIIFPFEECPEAIRRYITAKAGLLFGQGRVGDMQAYRFNTAAVQYAYDKAVEYNTDAESFSARENPYFYKALKR